MGHTIEFTLQHAKNVNEEDGISKNDLYAVILYGGQKTKSDVASDGIAFGHSYSWDQTFQFDYKTNDDDIEVKLYDKDVGFDDYLGEAKFGISSAKSHGSSVETVSVVTKTREVKGTITAKIVFK